MEGNDLTIQGFSGSLPERINNVSIVFLILITLIIVITPSESISHPDRKVNTALLASYVIFDSEYFGMDSAVGTDIVLRYGLFADLYLESRLGTFASSNNDTKIHGFNSQIGITAFAQDFLPFRPGIRVALGLYSTNPVIVTPTETFRPSQTTFYFITGLNIGRYIWKGLLVEIGADVMFTPYEYKKYTFARPDQVSTENAQFTHFVFSLGTSFSF